MRSALVVALILTAACSVDVEKELPLGALLSCSAANDCPLDMACDTVAGLCAWSCTIGTSTGCAPNNWCRSVGGTPTCSQFYQPNGGVCSVDYQCVSNHCSGGICCDSGNCCNGSTVNCPGGSNYCDGCTGMEQIVGCNQTTFTCRLTAQASSNAGYCDGQSCADSYCDSTTCTYWQCATCGGGACGLDCSDTGNPCC